MSKQRARRRAEREAAEAAEAQHRRRQHERRAARAQRRRAIASALPRPVRTGRPQGLLEQRRRRRNLAVVVVLVLVQVATWLLTDSWWIRFGVLGLSVLLAPVVVTLLTDRRL